MHTVNIEAYNHLIEQNIQLQETIAKWMNEVIQRNNTITELQVTNDKLVEALAIFYDPETGDIWEEFKRVLKKPEQRKIIEALKLAKG